MPKNTIYYNDKEMNLMGHHIKSSVVKRLDNGFITIYDIRKEDLNGPGKKYLEIAESKGLVVFLTVRARKRLLIFNRQVC